MAKYDNLVNKHVVVKNKLMTLKKTSESRRHANKESIAYLKKKGTTTKRD
jgi:hypothetical protein